MNELRTFIRIIAKSIRNRRTRAATAALAVVLGVSLITSLAAISLDARQKVNRELRSFGANVVIAPRPTELRIGTGEMPFGTISDTEYLSETVVDALRAGDLARHVAGYVPYLYGIVHVRGQAAVLVGTNFERLRTTNPAWQIIGRWPEAAEQNAAVIGIDVATKLNIGVGQKISLNYREKEREFDVIGIIETGSSEDTQVLVGLGAAQEILEIPGLLSAIHVSLLTDIQPVSATAEEIARRIPGTKVTVLSQIAEAEESITNRIQTLLLIVSLLVLFTSLLTVTSTMMTSVLERTREIGLMKALGASEMQVAALFLAEAAIIGVCGGVIGFAVGNIIAYATAQTVFGSPTATHILVLPISLVVALATVFAASALPVKRALAIDPAITLRGE